MSDFYDINCQIITIAFFCICRLQVMYTKTYDALKTYIDMVFDGLRADIAQIPGGGRILVNAVSCRMICAISEQKMMCLFRISHDMFI